MPVLSLACHLPHNTPNIPSRYNNEQTTKQTKGINNSYIYISCKCDTNRAGHFTFDAYASRPVACQKLTLQYKPRCRISKLKPSVYTLSLYDDVITREQFPHHCTFETGEVPLMLDCISSWTNSQVTIDYTLNAVHVVLLCLSPE